MKSDAPPRIIGRASHSSIRLAAAEAHKRAIRILTSLARWWGMTMTGSGAATLGSLAAPGNGLACFPVGGSAAFRFPLIP